MRFKLPTKMPSRFGDNLLKSILNSGDLTHARQVFDRIPQPTLHSWAYLMTSYTKQGLPSEAVKLYSLFRNQRVHSPDRILLLSAAKACAAYADVRVAKEVHDDAVRYGFLSDVTVGNALINMYAKCKCCEGAQVVFNELQVGANLDLGWPMPWPGYRFKQCKVYG